MINEFFSRSHTKWNLKDFLTYFLNPAQDHDQSLKALTNAWTSSLDAIRRDGEGNESSRSRKARLLREQWDQNSSERNRARTVVEASKAKQQNVSVISNTTFFGEVQTVYSGSSAEIAGNSRNKRDLSLSPTPSDTEAHESRKRQRKKRKSGKKQEVGNNSGDWRQRFVDMFNAMDPEKKTKLSSGAVVEDIIFTYACGLEKRAPEHSFIIDSENLSLKRLFGADWTEIVTRLDSRREILRNFLTPQSLEWIPDDVTTTAQLRKVLYGPTQPQGLDEEWVSDVYRQFLFLLEHPDKPLTRDHCENWFEVMVLGRLINRCIMTLPSVEVLCKESISVATRGHLNQNRTQTGDGNHLLPCPRLDSIFKLIQPDYEFGGCEVGKYDKGTEDTKRIEDFNKLVTTMSHMLRRLHQEVKVSCPQELEVIGLLCSGLTLQPFRMYSDRYLCFLVRYEILRIPAHEKRIRDIKVLLKSMWLVKKTINDAMDLLLNSDTHEAH